MDSASAGEEGSQITWPHWPIFGHASHCDAWRPHGDSKIAALDNTTGSSTVLLCFDE
jgi:hypothetical protein